ASDLRRKLLSSLTFRSPAKRVAGEWHTVLVISAEHPHKKRERKAIMRQGKRARSVILMTPAVRRSRPSDEARSARGAIARLRVMRAGGRTLVLLAVLWAALAGNARAATAPFIPIDLGTLGGSDSAALAVNARGQVVGYSSMTRYGAETHAFSWTQAGGMIDLGTLGGMNSLAEAVNDRGQVVGWSDTPADTGVGVACCSVSRAFSWTQAGGMLDLG